MADKHVMPVLPKFDVEAFVALQKANVETVVAAQKIMFDLAQTVTKKQVEMFKEFLAKSEAMMKGFDGRKQPGAYADEVKAITQPCQRRARSLRDVCLVRAVNDAAQGAVDVRNQPRGPFSKYS